MADHVQHARVAGAVGGDSDRRPRWIALAPASVRHTVLVVFAAVVGLTIAVWAFQALSSFLFLLLLAWLLSIAMEPMVLWLIRLGLRRGLAAGVVILAMMLIVVGVAAMFGQVFVSQAQELKDSFPAAVRNVVEWLNSTFHTSFDVAQIEQGLQQLPEKLPELAQQYGGGLLGVFGAAVTAMFDLVTILVFAYYLSADSIRLRQTIGSFLPPRYQPVLMTVWTIAVEKTGGYVVSKLVLALVSAIFHAVFFRIIDVPFWLPLGVLAGITSQFVPIIGTYIGVILPALFAALHRPISVVWIVVFATIYQQIESYWFTPMVSRRTMDIHPALALASVFVGVGLVGPIGALIGIPVTAAVLTIVETFRARHDLLPELVALEDAEASDPPAVHEPIEPLAP
ncbi:MAG: AI-2E family transporter [Dermatophilaceae bacterium]